MNQGDLYMGSTYGIVGYRKNGSPIYGHTAITPPSSPPPMPQMSQYKPPQLTNATIGATGKGISRPSDKRKPTRLSDLRANRRKLRINEQLTATGTGTGLNIGGLT